MAADNLEKAQVIVNRLWYISAELENISSAFSATGNNYMGDKLAKMAEDLYQNRMDLFGTLSDIRAERHSDAVSNSKTVLQAVLAGIEINEQQP